MLLVGVCERRENARPVSMFVCDCSLSSTAILAAYSNAEHKFESTALLLKPLVSQKFDNSGDSPLVRHAFVDIQKLSSPTVLSQYYCVCVGLYSHARGRAMTFHLVRVAASNSFVCPDATTMPLLGGIREFCRSQLVDGKLHIALNTAQ